MSTQSDQSGDTRDDRPAESPTTPPPTAAPLPPPPAYVVRIDIDEHGHADIDAARPRAYVIAALRHIADELEAQG